MYEQKKIKSLLKKVEGLVKNVLDAEKENKYLLKNIHPDHLLSARNLLHYLSIRSHDLRSTQRDLSELAISSHSHSESYTLNNLQKIIYLLHALAGARAEIQEFDPLDCNTSGEILKRNAETLLGRAGFSGQSKIMVTMPTEAGEEGGLVHDMIKAGMHIARINTAHDDAALWGNMVKNIKKAATALDRKVKIYMDIEGPKMRTGPIKAVKHEGSEKSKMPSIQLYTGSRLKIMREETEGHGGAQPVISLTLPEVFDHVKRDERVWFDDGQIGGVIVEKKPKYLLVDILHAPEDGYKLKAEKGVNFPDSLLHLPALTKEDLEHLKFIAAHADMVGFSFVQTEDDVYSLQKHLKRLKRADMGIILKIETQLAFKNLPSLLFAVMRSPSSGIMVARGDLAVEIGYSRLAEVQEEILWLAEAAHMPVIWATQVLETQVKKGIASRAEISDVVKAVRAECVMLNKGPHILEAIATIRDIDKRMGAHEDKKRKILRSLHVAKEFLQERAEA